MDADAVFDAIKELHSFTEFSIGKLSRDLGDRMTGVEGRLTGMEGRLDGVERRLGRVETRFEVLEERVGDLQTTMHDGFHEVRERLTALERSSPRA